MCVVTIYLSKHSGKPVLTNIPKVDTELHTLCQ